MSSESPSLEGEQSNATDDELGTPSGRLGGMLLRGNCQTLRPIVIAICMGTSDEASIRGYERLGGLGRSSRLNHEVALLFQDEIAGQCQFLATDYVLDELYTLLLMNIGYANAISFKRDLDVLRRAGTLQVVWISEDPADEAWRVFEQFNLDKEWSFTDCVSYAVMKRQRITEVFAFDHHF